MNPTERWTDERIDDLANEIRPLRTLQTNVAEIAVEFRQIRQDQHACFEQIRDVNRKIDEAEEKREHEKEETRKEQIAQRRWMVGSAFSAAGLVIAALAILSGSS